MNEQLLQKITMATDHWLKLKSHTSKSLGDDKMQYTDHDCWSKKFRTRNTYSQKNGKAR